MILPSWNLDFKAVVSPLCVHGAAHGWTDVHLPLYYALFKHVQRQSLHVGCDVSTACAHTLHAFFDQSRVFSFGQESIHDTRLIPCPRINYASSSTVDAALQAATTSRGLPPQLHLFLKRVHALSWTADEFVAIVNGVLQYAVCPGGMFVLENIPVGVHEAAYTAMLAPLFAARILQDAYFVAIAPRCGYQTIKLLVLVRGGAPPLFGNRTPLTIITPCCRPENLAAVAASIPWDIVHKWYIVYDGARVETNPRQFAHIPAVIECVHKAKGSIAGNAQRNHALELIQSSPSIDSFLFFLDDDNTFHPSLANVLRTFACDDMLYSFNQGDRLRGTKLRARAIDTAMVLLSSRRIGHLRWKIKLYHADGLFIEACAATYGPDWTYIDNDLCTYNVLRKT